MNVEAPVDAWYVWLGVSLVSLAVAGVVLGLPTGPPPDAEHAANAIEETAASSYEASTTLEHDADAINVDGKTVALRNDHGTARSSITYGQVVAVNGDERLERLVYGADFEDEFESELENSNVNAATAFMDRVAAADENTSGEWLTASESLTVRQLSVSPDEMPELSARGTSSNRRLDDRRLGDRRIPTKVVLEYREFDEPTTVTYSIDGSTLSHAHDPVIGRYATVSDEAERTFVHNGSGTASVDLDRHLVDGKTIVDGREIDDNDSVDGSLADDHMDVWIGDYPLTVAAEFDDETCAGTIFYSVDSGDLCPQLDDTAERAAELDWIELNDETERYHVTLVVV